MQTIDEINALNEKYEPQIQAQLIQSFWEGVKLMSVMRHDMPDGAWDEISDMLPRNDDGKISKAAISRLTAQELSELMDEVQDSLEDWGLTAPW